MDYQVETNIYQTDAIADGIKAGVNQYDAWLDQQAVYDKLTNFSADQGVYLENGKLYINASMIHAGYLSADHIRGGTLTLGGSGNESGEITVYNADGGFIGGWDSSGFLTQNGKEYLKIFESVLMGGYGVYLDGTLDLSAQEDGRRDVVLDALTYDLIVRSQNGKTWVISGVDTQVSAGGNIIMDADEFTFYRGADTYTGRPVLTTASGDNTEIRRAYITVSGTNRYLYIRDGAGNTYRTGNLTAVT